MNKFSECEEIGRYKFLQQISGTCHNIRFTQNQYDKVDVFWEHGLSSNVGEIKYRSGYTSDNKYIAEQGAVLEKTKYDALNYYSVASGITPYYIMIFADDKIAIFNLNKIKNIEFKNELYKYPKTTCGDNRRVEKEVTYLPLSLAKIVNLKYS